MDLDTMKGTVQGFFDRAFVEVAEKEYETPLANSDYGVKAKLAPKNGTFVQFRSLGDLPLTVTVASDSPQLYAEDEEPASAMVLTDDVFQVSLQDLAGFLELRPRLIEQDPVDILSVTKKRLVKWARRMIHTVVNDRMVVPIGVAMTNLSNTYVKAPLPLRTIYAGGAAGFAGLKADSFVTLADIVRGAALLRNGNVPLINDRVVCVIDSAGIQQLALGDSKFMDAIKRVEDASQKMFGAGSAVDYAGVAFKVQSDGYRCQLPTEGGALRTRKNTGKVRVCHLFGENTFGYLDLGEAGSEQRKLLAPSFKVQDITVTGNKITCALRFPMQAMVMQRNNGVNLAYTSAFDETPLDLPDEDA
jgi:hypothetical protein